MKDRYKHGKPPEHIIVTVEPVLETNWSLEPVHGVYRL